MKDSGTLIAPRTELLLAASETLGTLELDDAAVLATLSREATEVSTFSENGL